MIIEKYCSVEKLGCADIVIRRGGCHLIMELDFDNKWVTESYLRYANYFTVNNRCYDRRKPRNYSKYLKLKHDLLSDNKVIEAIMSIFN